MINKTQLMVAVVDDDLSVQKALRRLIMSFGFETECFASADEYLVTRREKPPDCLVLDVHMAGMNGIELQAELRRSGSKVPIVFITALDDGLWRGLAMEGGAVDFLPKPCGDDALMEAVQRAVRTQRREE